MAFFNVLNIVGKWNAGVPAPVSTADPLPVSCTYSELVARMLNTVAAPGYIIQPTTVNTDFLYIMEAPAGTGVNTVGLRGIRVKLTSGKVDFGTQYNLGATCTMTNYRTDAGWLS